MAGIHNVLAGASSGFSFTIATNQTNLNLRTAAIAAGWNALSTLTVVINSGVVVSSNNTATPALTVDGDYPLGVKLTNRGSIFGMGGAGGDGGRLTSRTFPPSGTYPTAGGPGGLALSVASDLTLDNSAGVIGGGGGGGGGGGAQYQPGSKGDSSRSYSGSGGGGGITGATISFGGAGQPAGTTASFNYAGSNGASGSISAAGTGGIVSIDGGNGGSRGASGVNGQNIGTLSSNTIPSAEGGAGGGAISGNSFITYIGSTGTRLGSIT